MYPVLSVLRRAAVSYVYVTPAMLTSVDGSVGIRLEKKSNYLLLNEEKWTRRAVEVVPVSELVVVSDSAEEAAISLAKKENAIAAAIKAEDALYTIVMGPEEQTRVGDKVVRRFRCAVIEGVFRVSSTQGLAPEPAKGMPQRRFTGAPKKRGVRLD